MYRNTKLTCFVRTRHWNVNTNYPLFTYG